MSESGYKHLIKNSKQELNIAIYQLRLHNPKWHPDWEKFLGYKLARILFLAGVTEIKHGISFGQNFNLFVGEPSLQKQTIYIYPHINSSLDSLQIKDKIDKSRPLIWTLLNKFGFGITGTAHTAFTQISSIKNQELYSDIVLYFKYFQEHFKIVD